MKTYDKYRCRRCEKITYVDNRSGALKCVYCESRALILVGSVTFTDEEAAMYEDDIAKEDK